VDRLCKLLRRAAMSAYVSIRPHTDRLCKQTEHLFCRKSTASAWSPSTPTPPRRHFAYSYCAARVQRQYLYFCTSKASKLSTCARAGVSICTFVLVKQAK
jgi:hypothetical protein